MSVDTQRSVAGMVAKNSEIQCALDRLINSISALETFYFALSDKTRRISNPSLEEVGKNVPAQIDYTSGPVRDILIDSAERIETLHSRLAAVLERIQL